jgi:hypothetical protein
VKKAERKTWKVAMVGLEQSDNRLRKLQAAANKGHEAIGTSFKGDLNQIAASIVAQPTGQSETPKNPAAVALGRLGGLKGGKARAANLSTAKRKAIAKKAAQSRWSKH